MDRSSVHAVASRLRRMYRRQTRKERLYSVVNLILSIASVVLYVRSTFTELSVPLIFVDLCFTLWFVFIFVYEFLQANDLLYHLRRWMTLFDFLSLIPIVRFLKYKSLGSVATIQAFKAFRVLRVHRLLAFYPPGSKRRIVESGLLILCILFLLTSLMYEVGQRSGAKFAERNVTFLESFYFVIVTFTTVGYGDIYPAKEASRLILAVLIPPMIVVFPVVFNRVFNEVSSWPRYAKPVAIAASRNLFRRGVSATTTTAGFSADPTADDAELAVARAEGAPQPWQHVVVAGNLMGDDEATLGRQLPVFLEHVFLSHDRTSKNMQLVVLGAHDPPKIMEKCILEHPYYQSRVAWVTGSAYEEQHVEDWARALEASAVVVVGDSTASVAEYQQEDERTVRQTVAIKRMLEDYRDEVVNERANEIRASQSLRRGSLPGRRRRRPMDDDDDSDDDEPWESLLLRADASLPPPQLVVAGLLRERNAFLLKEEERKGGLAVVAVDQLKYALLARSIRVPLAHSLMTSLVCKRPRRRLVVDDNRLTAFDHDHGHHGGLFDRVAAHPEFEHEPSVMKLEPKESAGDGSGGGASSSIGNPLSSGGAAAADGRPVSMRKYGLQNSTGSSHDSSSGAPPREAAVVSSAADKQLPEESKCTVVEMMTTTTTTIPEEPSTSLSPKDNDAAKMSKNSTLDAGRLWTPSVVTSAGDERLPGKALRQTGDDGQDVVVGDDDIVDIDARSLAEDDYGHHRPSAHEYGAGGHRGGATVDAERMERDLSASYNLHQVQVREAWVGARFDLVAVAAHEAIRSVAAESRRNGESLRRRAMASTGGWTPLAAARSMLGLSTTHGPPQSSSSTHGVRRLGALPVAVVADRGHDEHRRRRTAVVNFPAMYRLNRGDALLVVARSRADAEVVLSHVDYDDVRRRDEGYAAHRAHEQLVPRGLSVLEPVSHPKPACAAARSTGAVASNGPPAGGPVAPPPQRSIDAEAVEAMRAAGRLGRRDARSRARAMAEWISTHVVAEVPHTVSGHVVFCGPVDHAPLFLQPLLVSPVNGTPPHRAGSTSQQPAAPPPPPTVVILDHANHPEHLDVECDLDDGHPRVSKHYAKLLEDVVFYDPLPDDDASTHDDDDDDGAPCSSSSGGSSARQHGPPRSPSKRRRPRLYVVLGDPLERPGHSRASAFPSALERSGVERASHFVLPKVKDGRDDRHDDIFLDDDFNCRVARNVDALICDTESVTQHTVFHRETYNATTRILVEVDDPAKVRDFLTVRRRRHAGVFDDDGLGAFGDGSSHDCKCEIISNRLVHAMPIVAAVDSAAILDFTKAAVCAYTVTGALPKWRLSVGGPAGTPKGGAPSAASQPTFVEFESACVACVAIPDEFVDETYGTFLAACVAEKAALPIALYRHSRREADRALSRRGHSECDLLAASSPYDDHGDDDEEAHDDRADASAGPPGGAPGAPDMRAPTPPASQQPQRTPAMPRDAASAPTMAAAPSLTHHHHHHHPWGGSEHRHGSPRASGSRPSPRSSPAAGSLVASSSAQHLGGLPDPSSHSRSTSDPSTSPRSRPWLSGSAAHATHSHHGRHHRSSIKAVYDLVVASSGASHHHHHHHHHHNHASGADDGLGSPGGGADRDDPTDGEPFYIYLNPLPGDHIRKFDRVFVLANSASRLDF